MDTNDRNPFKVEALRLSQDFRGGLVTRKALLTVPVRKPAKQVFVRTHPDPAYRIHTVVLEDQIDRLTYLVAPELRDALRDVAVNRLLITAVTRQGDPFLWSLTLPGPDGRANPWNESALQAAAAAEKDWVRVQANMSNGMYDVFYAEGELTDPQWPKESFEEILKLAFRDRYIDSLDHPVMNRLRGRA